MDLLTLGEIRRAAQNGSVLARFTPALDPDLTFGPDHKGYEVTPTTVVLDGGTDVERVLALDFRPIEENGKIDRIMMLVSDETQVRHLERAVQERQEAHDRQMSAMRRLVAGGGQLLVSILSRAREGASGRN